MPKEPELLVMIQLSSRLCFVCCRERRAKPPAARAMQDEISPGETKGRRNSVQGTRDISFILRVFFWITGTQEQRGFDHRAEYTEVRLLYLVGGSLRMACPGERTDENSADDGAVFA